MGKFKVLKLVLKGEIREKLDDVLLEDGSVLEYDKIKKICVPSKKNQVQIITNKRTGSPMLIPSKSHQKWHHDHMLIFERWREEDIIGRFKIPLPIQRCRLKVLYYFPDNRRRDLTNKTETICDILVDIGIIEDDCFQVLSPILLEGFVQRDKPRTEIYITVMSPELPDYETDITSKEFFIKQKARKNEMDRKRIAKNRAAGKY